MGTLSLVGDEVSMAEDDGGAVIAAVIERSEGKNNAVELGRSNAHWDSLI